jgi:hypothetical protein
MTTTHLDRAKAARQNRALNPEHEPPTDPIATAYLATVNQDSTRMSKIAGTLTADQLVRAQFDHGLSADQVEARQESIVAALFSDAISPAEQAFARAYASVVDTYTADFRNLEKEAGERTPPDITCPAIAAGRTSDQLGGGQHDRDHHHQHRTWTGRMAGPPSGGPEHASARGRGLTDGTSGPDRHRVDGPVRFRCPDIPPPRV